MAEITPWLIYKSYPGSDMLPIAEPGLTTTSAEFIQSATDCGDTLFTFLARELSDCNKTEALRRLQIAMGDLQAVYNAIERL